jgi:transcriptional regulator with XRE-family HTH domain
MASFQRVASFNGGQVKLDLKRLGEAIRLRRKWLGWSLIELSEMSGVSAGFISDLENGKGGRPNVEYLFHVTTSLGTTIDALIDSTIGPRQQCAGADESAEDMPVPPSLMDFARAHDLGPDEVRMLATLNYRGRRPKDPGAWQAIYDVIRLLSR